MKTLQEKIKIKNIFFKCYCINWHPSIKNNKGKKARCSYCGKLRILESSKL